MQIGLSLNGDQVTLEETLQFARQAEAQGFASVWVPEAWRDAFVPLTAIALQTSRIRIGTAIALAMARSPVLMEKAAASLDELSHGRLTLGIGPGPKRGMRTGTASRFTRRPPTSGNIPRCCG